jgi:CheY-like chemotaxis protein
MQRALGQAPDGITSLVTRQMTSPRVCRRPRRILLAEDHPVNQRLAVRLLETWGHSVHLVSNGRKAVEANREQDFDLIFLDVQMPEMSGLDAAAIIRSEEKTSGKHTPIVAVTAHAMKGDRERCLKAGMDYYLTKPLNSHALFELIEQFQPKTTFGPAPSAPATQTPEAVSKSAPATSAFDMDKALTRMDGDLPLLQELAQMFLEDFPQQTAKIQTCIQEQDAHGLEHAAHALKGAVGNFGAYAAQEAARRLENMGRAGQMDEAGRAFHKLQQELARLAPALDELVKQKAA